MLKNYLKIALRSAKCQGGITLLILLGWLLALRALVAAFFTVSYQAIKAASANPIESLKYE